ncbi:MAG: hypothetical protein Q4C89_04920 [Deinococcus sp.]|uniref:hypothetical protein n=1 Tax=Deinococcus sp. TaxID=47478 RepID=UPI0026DA7005|nr:hypothetical protein [Deinococcus sp.]MDO4245342.1 hypothetical protein [Deinococcus sp.]
MTELKIRITGVQDGSEVSPLNAPLKEVRDVLDALYKLIDSTDESDTDVTVRFERGSLAVVTPLPITTAAQLAYAALQPQLRIGEPYHQFVTSLERTSKRGRLNMSVERDDVRLVSIGHETGANLHTLEPRWVKTTLSITGEIVNMGGKNPNIHVQAADTGDTHIIAIDRRSVQELRLYHRYVFDVQAEQTFDEGRKLRNLKYRSHLTYPKRLSLQEMIEREAPKWADVENPDEWLSQLRGSRDYN